MVENRIPTVNVLYFYCDQIRTVIHMFSMVSPKDGKKHSAEERGMKPRSMYSTDRVADEINRT